MCATNQSCSVAIAGAFAAMAIALAVWPSPAQSAEPATKGIQWRRDCLLDAYKQAVNENKLLVILFRTDQCQECNGPCRHCGAMLAFLQDERFSAIADRAIFVSQDPEKDDGQNNAKKLAAAVDIDRFPTISVLEVHANKIVPLAKVIGLFPPDETFEKIVRGMLTGTSADGLKTDPAWAPCDQARASLDKGDYAAAVTQFGEAIRLNPRYAVAYYGRGVAQAGKGDLDQAIADYTKVIEFSPQHYLAYAQRGDARCKRREFDLAVADYTAAIRLLHEAPTTAEYYCSRGRAQYSGGAAERAIADFTAAIRIKPNCAEAYHRRGEVYRQQGKAAEAQSDFAQAEKLGYKAPDHQAGGGKQAPALSPPTGYQYRASDAWVAPGPADFSRKYDERIGGSQPPAEPWSEERQLQEIIDALRQRDAARRAAEGEKPPAGDSRPSGAEQPVGPGVVPRVTRATAWVLTPTMSGTAWVYDAKDRILVTNFHVIANSARTSDTQLGIEPCVYLHKDVRLVFPTYRDNGKGELITERSYYLDNIKQLTAAGRAVAARVVDADMKRDLAVLQAESLPDDILAIPLAAKSQNPRDVHFSIGNASSSFLWLCTDGKTKQRGFQDWRSQVGDFFLHQAAQILVTEGQTNVGDSGGPVVNEQGELVAVTQGFATNANAIHFAIDLAEVRAFLQETAWLMQVKTPDDRLRRARYYAARDLPLAAVDDFQAALAGLDRTDSAARAACLLDLAAVERRLGLTQEAIAHCDAALAEKGVAPGRAYAERAAAALHDIKPPGHLRGLVDLGKLLAPLKQTLPSEPRQPTAVELVRRYQESRLRDDVARALKADPDCALAYWVRAEYRAISGPGSPEEIADRSEVVRLRNGDATALLERERAYYCAKQYDLAIADCRAALKLAPNSVVAHIRLAECQQAKGDLASALAGALAVAEGLEPENPANWELAARIAGKTQNYQLVVESLTKAMQAQECELQRPPKRQHYVERGDAYAALKQYDEARADYRAALKTEVPLLSDFMGVSDAILRQKLSTLPREP